MQMENMSKTYERSTFKLQSDFSVINFESTEFLPVRTTSTRRSTRRSDEKKKASPIHLADLRECNIIINSREDYDRPYDTRRDA